MELGLDNLKKRYWLHIPHPKVDWGDATHSSFLGREKVTNMEVRSRGIPDQALKAGLSILKLTVWAPRHRHQTLLGHRLAAWPGAKPL